MTAPTVEEEPNDRNGYVVGVTRATVANLQEMIRAGRMKPGKPCLRSAISLET